jgi:hypothetical protein
LPGAALAARGTVVSKITFTAGFIWPIALLPEPVLWISRLNLYQYFFK